MNAAATSSRVKACRNLCDIAVKDGRLVGVRGRATDVVNHGRLGPKGLYGSAPSASSPDRLTRPMAREGGGLVETDWNTAMGRVVEVEAVTRRERSARRGFYTTSPAFLGPVDSISSSIARRGLQLDLEVGDLLAGSAQLGLLVPGQSWCEAVVDPVLASPGVDRLLTDVEITRDLRDRSAVGEQVQDLASGLWRVAPSSHCCTLMTDTRIQSVPSTERGIKTVIGAGAGHATTVLWSGHGHG